MLLLMRKEKNEKNSNEARKIAKMKRKLISVM
jgi:hypothetical protein